MRSLLLVVAGCLVWACDDDGGAASPTPDAASDAALDAAPDAAVPAVLPAEGLWRLQLAFADLGVVFDAELDVTTGLDTLGLTLRILGDDGAKSPDLIAVSDIPVTPEGTFEVALDQVTIPGAFSPTASDLRVNLRLVGEVRDEGFFCGTVTGNEETLMLDLGRGTFAAVPAGGVAPPAGCDADPELPAGPIVGGDRPARVLLPADYEAEPTPRPLIVLLHAFGTNGAAQDTYLGLGAQQDTDGFLMLVPEGTPNPEGEQFWNATEACCDTFNQNIDDVGYISDIIDETTRTFRVDPTRIYLVGHSNGHFMSYVMACALGDRIAAVAGLAGATVLDEATCASDAAVSVLHVHARDDATIPYDGDPDPVAGHPGAEETTRRWATRAGCAEPPTAGAPLDLVASIEGAETEVTTWTGCRDGTEVALWSLTSGGHVPTFGPRFAENVLPWLLAQAR
jgi:polyhydroxybutyrate depolymerase